jgi:hypothetical protein
MSGLVEGIESYPMSGGVGRFGEPSAGGEGEAESIEHLAENPLLMFIFAALPVLEVGAVPEVETGHERAAEESDRRRQLWRTLGAEPIRPVRMVDPYEVSNLIDITGPVVAVKPDPGSVGVEPLPGETRPQRRQGPSQSCPGPIAIQVRPQQVGELLASGLLPRDRQIREQRNRFTGVDFEGLPVDRDFGRPQQGEAETGRGWHRYIKVRKGRG